MSLVSFTHSFALRIRSSLSLQNAQPQSYPRWIALLITAINSLKLNGTENKDFYTDLRMNCINLVLYTGEKKYLFYIQEISRHLKIEPYPASIRKQLLLAHKNAPRYNLFLQKNSAMNTKIKMESQKKGYDYSSIKQVIRDLASQRQVDEQMVVTALMFLDQCRKKFRFM